MSETLIVGLMSLVGTVIGTLGGIMAGNRLTAYRLEQLEQKVDKHNSVIERVYRLEGRMTEAEHALRGGKGGAV